MTAQPSAAKGSDPQPIFETATGFMRAKHCSWLHQEAVAKAASVQRTCAPFP